MVCHIVYALIIDSLRDRINAERIVATTVAIANGATGIDKIPVWEIEWEKFDEFLASEPEELTPENAERYELLRALGLRE